MDLIKEVRGLEVRMLGIAKVIKEDNIISIYKLIPKDMIVQKWRWEKEAQEMEEGLLRVGEKPGNRFWN